MQAGSGDGGGECLSLIGSGAGGVEGVGGDSAVADGVEEGERAADVLEGETTVIELEDAVCGT